MSEIKEILTKLYPRSEWNIEETSFGESENTFVADNGKRKVFIKYNVKSATLKRLSELGIAPKVIYDGTNEPRPFIIQEFVEGKHPDINSTVNWYANNLEILANLIKKYHQDELLKNILFEEQSESYQNHVEKEIIGIDESINRFRSNNNINEIFISSMIEFKEASRNLKAVPLVPTHADPNASNFLLIDTGLIMVDWDDIILSDPIKDISLILWWFVPKNKWSEFFNIYGEDLDEQKIYWWIARGTLLIATWYDKRDDKEKTKFFIDDFLLAIQRKDNSQMINNS